MDPNQTEYQPSLIEHLLLSPELTHDQVAEGCAFALEAGVASVLARPCDVDLVVRLLAGTEVAAGAACGHPHGFSTTAVKLYEVRDVLRRGVKEVALTLNHSKLLSRQFQYLESELLQAAEACHKEGAVLTVALDSGHLTGELRMVACRLCENTGADGVSAAPADLAMLRARLPERIALKAAGVSSLDELLAARDAGAARAGASETKSILAEWKARISAPTRVQ